MSHFSTLVITKHEPSEEDIANLLAPYDENKIVKRYVAKTKKQLVEDEKKQIAQVLKEKEAWEKDKTSAPFNADFYNTYIKPVEQAYFDNDEEALYQDAIRYYEPNELDKNGNLISDYNPKSKWDWWEIGGRWSGLLNGYNCAKKKKFPHVDLDRSEEDLIKDYPDQYQEWQDLLAGKIDSLYRIEYLQERYKDFRDYLAATINTSTWAVVDINGQWQEPGDMGWFGVSDADPNDEALWDKSYYDHFIKDLPDYYWLTVVDCHI